MAPNPTPTSRMKRAILGLVVALAVASTGVSVASGVTGWRIIRQGSTSGQFTVTAINGSVSKPRPQGIAVRFKGNVTTGMAVIACNKAFFDKPEVNVASWSRSYSHAGLYVLPMMRGADFCDVSASAGGFDRVVVQILRR